MKLLLKFPDQSESFTYGVEFGRLLEKIERGDELINNNEFPVRIENKELLEQTCKRFGYIAIFGEMFFDEWIEFMGIRRTINKN